MRRLSFIFYKSIYDALSFRGIKCNSLREVNNKIIKHKKWLLDVKISHNHILEFSHSSSGNRILTYGYIFSNIHKR
jgi:hypothetical protein